LFSDESLPLATVLGLWEKPPEVSRSAIGNLSDFVNIHQAREFARNLVQTMKLTKRNSNKIEREADTFKVIISELFTQYRNRLIG